MKKIFRTIILLMLAMSLVACSSNSGTKKSSQTQSKIADESNASKDNTSSSIEKSSKDNKNDSKKSKILVAYFSYQGHTRQVADWIQQQAGGDIFEIQPATSYSSDYDTTEAQAKREQQEKARPKLKTQVNNMDDYDVVFVGYPNWFNNMPMPVFTFLEQYNFSGKTIIPFCTNGGNGFGNGVKDMKSTLPNSKFLEGIQIRDNNVESSKDKVTQWINGLNLAK